MREWHVAHGAGESVGNEIMIVNEIKTTQKEERWASLP